MVIIQSVPKPITVNCGVLETLERVCRLPKVRINTLPNQECGPRIRCACSIQECVPMTNASLSKRHVLNMSLNERCIPMNYANIRRHRVLKNNASFSQCRIPLAKRKPQSGPRPIYQSSSKSHVSCLWHDPSVRTGR